MKILYILSGILCVALGAAFLVGFVWYSYGLQSAIYIAMYVVAILGCATGLVIGIALIVTGINRD